MAPVELRLSRVSSGDPRVRWLVLDLGARREKERELLQRLELEKANDVQDKLTTLISHELRTPLTMIVGNAALLARRRQTLSEEEIQETIDSIQQEARHLHSMMENLLALHRGDESAELEPLLLQRIVPDFVGRARSQLAGRDVLIDVDDQLPPVLGSQDYIRTNPLQLSE